jgi:hypothetical protein
MLRISVVHSYSIAIYLATAAFSSQPFWVTSVMAYTDQSMLLLSSCTAYWDGLLACQLIFVTDPLNLLPTCLGYSTLGVCKAMDGFSVACTWASSPCWEYEVNTKLRDDGVAYLFMQDMKDSVHSLPQVWRKDLIDIKIFWPVILMNRNQFS